MVHSNIHAFQLECWLAYATEIFYLAPSLEYGNWNVRFMAWIQKFHLIIDSADITLKIRFLFNLSIKPSLKSENFLYQIDFSTEIEIEWGCFSHIFVFFIVSKSSEFRLLFFSILPNYVLLLTLNFLFVEIFLWFQR